jgi:hypothetical protein
MLLTVVCWGEHQHINTDREVHDIPQNKFRNRGRGRLKTCKPSVYSITPLSNIYYVYYLVYNRVSVCIVTSKPVVRQLNGKRIPTTNALNKRTSIATQWNCKHAFLTTEDCRRRRRKGKSQIWESKIWSQVPRDSGPRKLRWRGPAAYTKNRPVLSSERSPQ